MSDMFPRAAGRVIVELSKLQRMITMNTGNSLKDAAGVRRNGAAAEFWNAIANYGAYDTIGSAATWKTICDLSGAGHLYNVIGPGGLTTIGDSVDIRITKDGVATTINWTADATPTNTWRLCLGFLSFGNEITSTPTVIPLMPNSVSDAGFCEKNGGIRKDVSSTLSLVYPGHFDMCQLSCVKFASSLKVEARTSRLYATANMDRAGAIYELD